jgi:hypothetical protein
VVYNWPKKLPQKSMDGSNHHIFLLKTPFGCKIAHWKVCSNLD